ncbi:MAG TPA: WGR domain-containing protein, partial [Gemmataceae bacterium]|nr:WGR domain-containing protein [Gemmataceae bacterium]
GVPRFPSYIGVRDDVELAAPPPPSPPPKSATASKPKAASAAAPSAPVGSGKRYFEFVAATSSKFWEVSVNGNEMTTRWGRIGSDGQSKTKAFKDATAAQAQADKLIAEKTADGYIESF